MLKITDFANLGPKYLGPQIFPRHAVSSRFVAVNSKYSLISQMF